MTEMQFHCLACGHRSEMFGFVKEVFKTCAKDWKVETLAKELQYVKRIFTASNDVRGKNLHDVAEQMLMRLEDKASHSEVINYVMAFLSGKLLTICNIKFGLIPIYHIILLMLDIWMYIMLICLEGGSRCNGEIAPL